MQNLYKVLGVEADASATAIKRAYRQRARDLHPDINHGNKHAAEAFRAVQEAYDVLSDPSRRAAYDDVLQVESPSDIIKAQNGAVATAPERVTTTTHKPESLVPAWLVAVLLIVTGTAIDHAGVTDTVDTVAQFVALSGWVTLCISIIHKTIRR